MKLINSLISIAGIDMQKSEFWKEPVLFLLKQVKQTNSFMSIPYAWITNLQLMPFSDLLVAPHNYFLL